MRPSMEGPKKALLFSSLFSIFIISNATDTITKTNSITGNQTLVSSDGSFEMGFFSPGSSNNFYLGIWYKKISTRTVVWVANRETPLLNSSGVLKVIDPGILVLITNNNKNEIIWNTSTTTSTQDPVVQLLETGNLILKDSSNNNNNPEKYLWQSFDYPCDTLLPGMKLGKNFHTGLERHLSSWKSDNDPAPGAFTYRCDPQGYPQNILSSGSVERYRTGPWNGLRFSGTPSLNPNSIYTYELVFNEIEVYFAYRLLNSSVISRFFVNQSGVVQRWTWVDRTEDWVLYLTVPRDNCDSYNSCGPYGSCNLEKNPVCDCLSKFVPMHPKDWENGDYSNGCVRRTALNCSNGDGFVPYSGFKMPDTRHSWYNRTMNLKECGSMCLRNCSCTAYTSLDIRGDGSGCLLWFDELIDMKVFSENNAQFIYVRMASSELDQHEGFSGKKRMRIIVILALVIGLLLLGLGLTLYYRKKKKKSSQPNREEGNLTHNPEQEHTDKSQKEDLELPLFDLAVIADSTDNFSINNKLGQGGFGPVYKGVLEGGQEIAVKRLSKSSSQGLDEFKNEVICIAKLQHRNLVRLLGCCIEGEEKLLIYEYLPNKSLDYFIFDRTQSTLLDWAKRFHIINGIARGLLYLHQDSRLRIIHRDLKAANILLDIDMNPKISDFGIARSFIGNETEANTNRVVGTYGYMSPEYAVDGQFSVKSDVFSFGVLVLEIVSGRKNRGFYHPDHQLNLLGHAWRLYKESRSLELIEEPLRDSHCNLSEAQRSIHMGLLCVQQCPEDRPSMSYVVSMLSNESALPEPEQPGFYTERRVLEAGVSSSKDVNSSSVNEMTITLLSAR